MIFKVEQKRTPRRGLQPGAVVIRGVVIADRRMSSTRRNVEIVVVRELKEVSLDVDAEAVRLPDHLPVNVRWPGFEHNFAQELEFVGYIRGHKKIELSQ